MVLVLQYHYVFRNDVRLDASLNCLVPNEALRLVRSLSVDSRRRATRLAVIARPLCFLRTTIYTHTFYVCGPVPLSRFSHSSSVDKSTVWYHVRTRLYEVRLRRGIPHIHIRAYYVAINVYVYIDVCASYIHIYVHVYTRVLRIAPWECVAFSEKNGGYLGVVGANFLRNECEYAPAGLCEPRAVFYVSMLREPSMSLTKVDTGIRGVRTRERTALRFLPPYESTRKYVEVLCVWCFFNASSVSLSLILSSSPRVTWHM